MKTIKRNNGNDIKIYATTLGDVAFEQIKELGEFEPYKDSKIRIMPDCHAGKGCTIGTTITITDKVTPNLVGVDIGCRQTARYASHFRQRNRRCYRGIHH